jgi:hypothetical protein
LHQLPGLGATNLVVDKLGVRRLKQLSEELLLRHFRGQQNLIVTILKDKIGRGPAVKPNRLDLSRYVTVQRTGECTLHKRGELEGSEHNRTSSRQLR